MAKTNPIGVRFDEDILADLKKKKIAKTPQAALSYYEYLYLNDTTNKPGYKAMLKQHLVVQEKKSPKSDRQVKEKSTKVESKSSGGESYLDRRRKMKSGA